MELRLMAEAEELAALMTALERDLSALIQSEYVALLNSVCQNLSGLPN
jgi:hypothetical protein